MPIVKQEVKRGLAALLWQFIEPLNFNEEFKEKFGDTNLNILLNPKDQKWAALLKIEKGKIDAVSVKNDDETLKNLKLDSLFEAPAETFLNLFNEGLSAGPLLIKMITRKVKIKGLRKMLALKDIFDLLA
jgi:hypothetical protein